jgi:hypothetical protein
MGRVPNRRLSGPVPDANCKTAQCLEPVYVWGPTSVPKHSGTHQQLPRQVVCGNLRRLTLTALFLGHAS